MSLWHEITLPGLVCLFVCFTASVAFLRGRMLTGACCHACVCNHGVNIWVASAGTPQLSKYGRQRMWLFFLLFFLWTLVHDFSFLANH